jgi:hypothetical protein
MEAIVIIIGIINIVFFAKLWGTFDVINKIGDVILYERENLKAKFINEVEHLHNDIKDPTEFKKAAKELAERYDEKQRIRCLDFNEMLKNFTW